jgi:hypothetical protein
MRKIDAAVPLTQVFLVQPLDALQVLDQDRLERDRQHSHPVLSSLAIADGDRVVDQVNVLHPQPKSLGQKQSGALEETKEEPLDSFDVACPTESATSTPGHGTLRMGSVASTVGHVTCPMGYWLILTAS